MRFGRAVNVCDDGQGVQPSKLLQTVERNRERLEKAQAVGVGIYKETTSKSDASCSPQANDRIKGAMAELKKSQDHQKGVTKEKIGIIQVKVFPVQKGT